MTNKDRQVDGFKNSRTQRPVWMGAGGDNHTTTAIHTTPEARGCVSDSGKPPKAIDPLPREGQRGVPGVGGVSGSLVLCYTGFLGLPIQPHRHRPHTALPLCTCAGNPGKTGSPCLATAFHKHDSGGNKGILHRESAHTSPKSEILLLQCRASRMGHDAPSHAALQMHEVIPTRRWINNSEHRTV